MIGFPASKPSKFYLWVIYKHPKDFPDKFVMRPQYHYNNGQIIFGNARFADTLDGIRRMVPKGLRCVERDDDDDPSIVEIWI